MPDRHLLGDETRAGILAWFARNRRVLPFRATTDPWAILVSEAMAQQTQAIRAGEVWTRFIAAYPTPGALAEASPADVLRAWQGLGYNRRALNLWRAARRIVELHGGRVPNDLTVLEALPGVGRYTARAVAAIAFEVPVGAVDTNVRRVLGRIVAGDAGALGMAALQALADAAVPAGRAGEWTHALMDLGAMVCTPRRPGCGACPAQAACRYAAAQRAAAAPADVGRAAGGTTARAPVSSPLPQTRRTPFPATARWLRGRIIDRLRLAVGDGWVTIEAPLGTHDRAAVEVALEALAREGLLELDGSTPEGARRARLPIA